MKLFFMHIPKTAGTSFRRFLERSVRERGGVVSGRAADGIWSPDSESYPSYAEFVASRAEPYRHCDLICGHYPYHVTEFLDPDTIVVTVLRNAIERCVSHVKHQMALERQVQGHCEPDVNAFLAAPRNQFFLQTIGNLGVKFLAGREDPDLIVLPEELSLDTAVANCCRTLFGFADEMSALQCRLGTLLSVASVGGLSVRRENESRDRFSVSDLRARNRELLCELNELDLLLEELMREVLAARSGSNFKGEERLAESA
jgi:hypothetical protein